MTTYKLKRLVYIENNATDNIKIAILCSKATISANLLEY